MGLLFESILLFSLAVLIILVGMLVYYFKKRIVDIEHKNAKCFEIVQDVYMQQMQLKKDVFAVLFKQQEEVFTQTQHLPEERTLNDRTLNERTLNNRIHVELSESEDDSDSESDDSESDDEDNESNRDESSQKIKSESEDEIIDEPESEIVSLNNQEPIVVNKVEDTRKPVSKEELQKMSPATLKSLLVSKGANAETVNKLKKKELVDMLL